MEFTRKNPRLNSEEYVGEKWFFITMCCENCKPIFLERNKVGWLAGVLRTEAIARRFMVDAYCIMPDHVHFLVLGMAPTSNLLAFAKSLKQKTSFIYQKNCRERPWQRNYYDHILRFDESPANVAAYIWMNPVRKGLCKSFDEYPFSGSFSRPWKIAS